MIAFISPAKTMSEVILADKDIRFIATDPRFEKETLGIVRQMVAYSIDELEKIYKVSFSIASQLRSRFINFYDEPEAKNIAIRAYDGVVYKHIQTDRLDLEDLKYLQEHLRICSLMYGLLRPCDLIKPYRMEPFVRLEDQDDIRIDRYWRDIHTDLFIEDINKAGGVLLYLSSKEEQNVFDWKKVKSQTKVVNFDFMQYKGDKLRTVTIYAKMARGEMVRYMIDNKVEDHNELKNFKWEGFTFSEAHSDENKFVFIQE